MAINEKATTFTYGTRKNDTIDAQYLLGDMIDGLEGDDTITGLSGNDTLLGGRGRDTIFGLDGNDLLDGGASNDKLYGGAGDDLIRPDSGAIGNDLVDGGDGIDTVDYSVSAAASGVTVDLRKIVLQDTKGAGKEIILNIENINGTNFVDTLTGNDTRNVLVGGNGGDTIYALDGHDQIDGGAGNDKLYGGLGNDLLIPDTGTIGNDSIDGGDGIDTINYQRQGLISGVTVDLSLITSQNTGGAGIDLILNVEQVQGSDLNDTIIGSNLDNWLNGNMGSDIINGGDGNDAIFSGAGDLLGDSLYGGNGDDKIRGGTGNDVLDGGAGADLLRPNRGADSLTGGSNSDTFIFTISSSGTGSDSNPIAPDLITDFNGLEDTIILQSTEWSPNSVVFLGSAPFTASGVSEVRLTYDLGLGTQRIEVDIEGNGSADIDSVINVIGTPIVADDLVFVSTYPF